MYRVVLTIVAAILIIAAGLWHGKITSRWGDTHELQDAVARITTLSMEIGDWTGKDVEMNTRHLQVAEVAGYVSRSYVNKRSGERVTLLLICGKPGPISVHTPDVCYQSAGYKMGTKSTFAIQDAKSTRPDEFWVAKFTKEPDPAPLHILWGWTTNGIWMAPDSPRFVFFQAPVLFKLYVVREVKSLDAPLVDEVTQQFMKDLVPSLRQVVTGKAASTSQ